LKKNKKILLVVQRSNGDVFLSASLLNYIHEHFNFPQIDLLVNEDTYMVASLLPFISKIYTFSYKKKSNRRWLQEKEIIKKLFRKYDLSINLTSSDRSVLYALIAGKKTISVVEKNKKKSWWKKLLLTHYYHYDSTQHILIQNLTPLDLLGIPHINTQKSIAIKHETYERVKDKLRKKNIQSFIIFHPSAQYNYKILPNDSRDLLISLLSKLGVAVVISGSDNSIDTEIKLNLPILPNIYDFIGETSLEEYFALSELSLAYIGMDTLNMHIAASQEKRIFAIFGPTNLNMWSPWSNQLKKSATDNAPLQTYDKNTIFQADMPCVACGNAGCDNKHGRSECLFQINPDLIFQEIKDWYQQEISQV
jgi:heptosyltransferase III